MIFLKILSQLVKALREGESPGQIAAGFTLGFLIGLTPFWTLQSVLLFLVLFVFKVNMAAGTLAILLAGLLAYLADPLFHALGYFILTGIPFLQGLWEALFNMPVAPLTRFNNTVVMGSTVVGLVLAVPLYFGMRKFVIAYRSGWEEKVKKWKVVQAVRSSKLVQAYVKIRDLGGVG